MPDYKQSFQFAEFWRTDVAPYLSHKTEGSVSFVEYLTGFYGTKSADKTFGIPLPYVYSLEWLKRFENKCVTFMYNSPAELQAGAPPITAIYQMSPEFHTMANVMWWIDDDGENDGHVTTFVVYENMPNIIRFCEDNLDIVKKPKPQQKGFAIVS